MACQWASYGFVLNLLKELSILLTSIFSSNLFLMVSYLPISVFSVVLPHSFPNNAWWVNPSIPKSVLNRFPSSHSHLTPYWALEPNVHKPILCQSALFYKEQSRKSQQRFHDLPVQFVSSYFLYVIRVTGNWILIFLTFPSYQSHLPFE